MEVRRLLADPAVVAAAARPLAELITGSQAPAGPLWRVPLTEVVDFVNLGESAPPPMAGHEGPGLALHLHLVKEGARSDDAGGAGVGAGVGRALWVAWGLPRPAVNLYLAPHLAEASPRLAAVASMDEAVELIASKSFAGKHIKTRVTVEDVLEPVSYRIFADTPLAEVQHLLLRRGLDMVPVVGSRHELLGLITDACVLPHALPAAEGSSGRRESLVAGDFMTRKVLCLDAKEELTRASRSLVARGVVQLPVASGGRLVGFLPGKTVMRAFAEAFAGSRTPVPVESRRGG